MSIETDAGESSSKKDEKTYYHHRGAPDKIGKKENGVNNKSLRRLRPIEYSGK